MTSRKKIWLTLSLIFLIVALSGAYGIWRILSNAPSVVTLEDAVATLTQTEESGDNKTISSGDPAESESASGEWVIDNTSGNFTFEDASGSFVGFRIDEKLVGIGSVTAVGRTDVVSGKIVIDGSSLVETIIEADLSTIVTNDSRRDRAARNALKVKENPFASFVLQDTIKFDIAGIEGQAIQAEALGQLTINAISQPANFSIDAQLVNNQIVLVGSAKVVFSDFGVEVPSAPIVVSAEDFGIIEFQLLLTRN
ncbi:MAG: YceI family protein [Actinomycetota bacterium]|nr:YceI family protein [Acidimicrobiales bacterium]